MNKLLSLTFVLAACASSPQATATSAPTPEAAADSNQDARDTCVASFERQRACTDEFIPALVDLRMKLDQPPGIAQGNREETITQARAEWANDSTDEAIAASCDKILASMDPAQVDGAMAPMKDCLAASECAAFVSCEMPLLEGMMSKQ
jgi:hypothetical protein